MSGSNLYEEKNFKPCLTKQLLSFGANAVLESKIGLTQRLLYNQVEKFIPLSKILRSS